MRHCGKAESVFGGLRLAKLKVMTDETDSQVETVAPQVERIGKVFVALCRDVRLCLVCEVAFTTQGAAEHAGTVCLPPDRGSRGEK